MNAATARSARRLTPWIVWISLPVAWCIVFGPQVVTYVFGTETTAHVTGCATVVSTDSNGNQTESVDCDGTWTLDGERHSGPVEEAEPDHGPPDLNCVHLRGEAATVGAALPVVCTDASDGCSAYFTSRTRTSPRPCTR